VDTPRPSPRTNRTRRVPHPVLIGHAASITPYSGAKEAGGQGARSPPGGSGAGAGARRGAGVQFEDKHPLSPAKMEVMADVTADYADATARPASAASAATLPSSTFAATATFTAEAEPDWGSALASPAFAATIKLGGDNGELGFFVSTPTRFRHR